MRRTNAESPDTFTAKLGFFDRTLAPHTDCLGVSCRVQAEALIEPRRVIGEQLWTSEIWNFPSACRFLTFGVVIPFLRHGNDNHCIRA